MTIETCLLAYGFTVAVLAPRMLVRLTHTGVAPKFGLTAWVCVLGSVLAAWIGAVVTLIASVVIHTVMSEPLVLEACYTDLHNEMTGRYGPVAQGGVIGLAGFAGLATIVLVARLIGLLVRARSSTHEHAWLARAAGRHDPGLDAVVVDVGEPAAYSVAGRPHAVVVTTGALAVLDERQLDAVLAHERAHLLGRHHVLLSLTRGLAAVLPRLEVFRIGAVEVARLLEMCADDHAVRTYGRHALINALVTMTPGRMREDRIATAADIGLVTRVERLAAPAATARRIRIRLLLLAAVAASALGPSAAVLAAVTGLGVAGSC
ncbi:M56 family metallopeptidase [Nocardia mexicana]|uniref:Peptidase M48-like protein n=1 Tax=Nocardia mexicana TaxID=279262 RepID=A0A370HA88_9NOCA|nr:M56 family metallopeptidase [Nocardia mexicana]RDI53356.1 peptidase M48-like protein [Nocardia mexicana]